VAFGYFIDDLPVPMAGDQPLPVLVSGGEHVIRIVWPAPQNEVKYFSVTVDGDHVYASYVRETDTFTTRSEPLPGAP